jgi:CHAD domain-containing protein
MAAFAEWQTQAISMLEKVRNGIDCWPLDHFKCKQLRCAVQTTYKCGREALAVAKANPSAETFHEFRAEAKVLFYQLRILRPINPVVLKNLSDELSSLGDLLGRAHDLSFLGERLRQEHGRAEWQREGHKLLALIEVSQGDLQRAAAELAERFFAQRPRDFGGRIASSLDDWATAKSTSLAEELVT